MANIIRRPSSEAPARRANPLAQIDPLRLFRDVLRWDPFAEMVPAQIEQQLGQFAPSFEIKETRDAYQFKADLPGVADEDLEIALAGNRLTVSGRREAEQVSDDSDRFYAYERTYGSFSRSFTLPEEIDPESVTASLDNGVLTIMLPKKPEAQPRKISVGAAQPQKMDKQQTQGGQPKDKDKPKA
jgi:HSP20 family protein